jgi:prepilin signal peptidase PulO-like enzyme (type II secretory pathway)
MIARGMFRPGMRAYIIPLVAGVALAVSAFLPWVIVEDESLRGFPDTNGLWIVGLGVLATILALLSLITRKNSRHPLLLVGLVAFGIMFLSWRLMPRVAADRALTRSQALAIVENAPLRTAPVAEVGSGIYLGLTAAVAIVGFGLTIVVKRAAQPYVVVDADDDV